MAPLNHFEILQMYRQRQACKKTVDLADPTRMSAESLSTPLSLILLSYSAPRFQQLLRIAQVDSRRVPPR